MYMGRDESVAYCLDFPVRPPTPEHVKPFRHLGEPGIPSKHYGYKDNETRGDGVYGSVNKSAATGTYHVLDTTKPVMTQYIEDRAEEEYYKRYVSTCMKGANSPPEILIQTNY
jgi:hypothetical protein